MKKLLLILTLLFSFSFSDVTDYFNSIKRPMVVSNQTVTLTDDFSKNKKELIYNIAYTLFLFEDEDIKFKTDYTNFVYICKRLKIQFRVQHSWIKEWNTLDGQEQAYRIMDVLGYSHQRKDK